MRNNSFYKVIFWILASLFGLLLLGFLGFTLMGRSIDPDFPIFMTFYFTIIFVIIVSVLFALAVFTYRDASKRGMDPWMWMVIVVFLPNFIGLIIYLIVRKSNTYEKICINCKKPVNPEFKLCPYCGAELNKHCPECGREISNEWTVCPYCSASLK
jgi:Predicted nucleic acid-binding protein, consists of a PIN domain and a Zn-ribbon module